MIHRLFSCLLVTALPALAHAETLNVIRAHAPVYANAGDKTPNGDALLLGTRVELANRRGEWCEVRPEGAGKSSFMRCAELRAAPLSAEEIRKALQADKLDPAARFEWTARAFWLQPSLGAWLASARALEGWQLDDKTREREYRLTKPLRPRNAEFDAMKARLAEGIVASLPSVPGDANWPAASSFEGNAGLALQRLGLPQAKPSYFHTGDILAVLPRIRDWQSAGLADALSAWNKAPMRVAQFKPAHYAINAPLDGFRLVDTGLEAVLGHWDVAALALEFYTPALFQGITAQARPVTARVQKMSFGFEYFACRGWSTELPGSAFVRTEPGSPLVKQAIVRWIGKPATDKARILTRKSSGKDMYALLYVDDIDLDGDGVADLSNWRGRYEPQVSAEGIWNAVYANIDGKWYLLSADEDEDCT
ncbi:hypothetical protein Q9Q94_03180 [Uliginosibacterium sp. 31-16]|uniref:hypothetical protein n=1 Tax=Uliginosibacterium sp. 31-16 TaxID=3068315 RepID=UPI00273E9059|nr:hypothetical protein [Uliginosibacterium sp. 31-16]MDP5238513.1 hypothetical protein [Uliginosibacterium sp. 31-16]